jgi:putative transposase
LTGGKKVTGRKRHIATDTMGNLLTVKVHAANIHDTMSGCHVYQAAKNMALVVF